MNAATARWNRSAAPSGRLPALLAAATFLLAALTGNSLSLHVGMTASAPEVAVAVDRVSAYVAGTGAVFGAEVGDVSHDAPAPMAVGSDAQHLMHLIGGMSGRAGSGGPVPAPVPPKPITPR